MAGPRADGVLRAHEGGFEKMETDGVSELLIPAGPGDMMIFEGGNFVHGSPAVRADEDTRFATYADFRDVC